MMIDPNTAYKLGQIQINEYLEQAQKDRLTRQLASDDSSILPFISAKVSGWIRYARPVERPAASPIITGEHQRATAEIPGV
jgi:hypothetical protein